MPPNVGEALAIIQSDINFDPRHVQKRDGEPAADWEMLPEFPTPEEIMSPDASTDNLPWFPVKHSWKSKAQYLEALYKILRFEAVEGLRYSVNSFRATPNMHDNDDTCVYTKVHVKGYLFAKSGPIARVCFSTYRAHARIKWQQSQRLMSGKIVAFSTDYFLKDCRIATIAQRPFEGGLDQNPPLVDIIWADPDHAIINPDQELVMIESRNGYYESVRHALRGLQQAMYEWSPIDKYTVSLDRRDLVCSAAPKMFDLGAIVSTLTSEQVQQSRGDQHMQQAMFQELKECFQQTSLGNFGQIKPHTSLDDSQLEALERIISKELAIIQGPPGTGKTHTSIQSLRTILANRKPGDPPVIVAAQTNHALDQLLLHCLASNVNIMRVGGRTDNKAIKERSVYELRLKMGKSSYQAKLGALERERRKIVVHATELVDDVFGGQGILTAANLFASNTITEAQFSSLEDEDWVSGKDISSMEVWLGEEKIERAQQLVDDFDFDEIEAVDERYELDANLDDDQAAPDDDDDRIYGEFIPLSSQHTGKTPLIPNWQERCQAMLNNDSLFDIPRGLRGGVYQILQSRLLDKAASEFRHILKKATQMAQKRKITRWAGDLHVVDSSQIDVIGCTTTGLTKYRGFISALKPHILLIEEAAETTEANIVSALFPSLRQLILVGDHQQLPPSCDISRLATDPYNLNVSLFERLVENGLPYTMLNRQRRMAPELSIIVKQFYKELQDHPLVEQVEKRALIPGMGERRAWFFNHQWPEQTDDDNSKFNSQEADMVVAFIIYLLRNGVSASEITVLTYYKGQKRKLLQRLHGGDVPKGNFFKVATVDSYQGEENDIVLLSLVRSPQLGGICNVGFLDSRNRATVAVSRAKRGFFLFGNKDNLLGACQASFLTWGPVWNGFASQKRVSKAKGLPLVCQKHNEEIWVKEARDLEVNAGGCRRPCRELRPCGHECALPCHFWPHEKLPCRVVCTKELSCGHQCGGLCSDPCSCPQNCAEARLQMSRLAISTDISSEASSGTGLGAQSRQSSPAKWKQFSHNPQIHDDAIRDTRRQEAYQQNKAVDIRETFVPVFTAEGRRAVKDAELRRLEPSFGKNAIGYDEQMQYEQQQQHHHDPSAMSDMGFEAEVLGYRPVQNARKRAIEGDGDKVESLIDFDADDKEDEIPLISL